MTAPYAELAELNQTSGLIDLYKLDCTSIGGSIYYFTNTPATGGSLSFASISYSCIPIQTAGWDFTSTGTTPKPTLTVSNTSKTLLSVVISLGDLVGATLTRWRVLAKHLDNGPNPDSSKFLGPEVYIIEQKTSHNNMLIQWQLTSILDRMGMMIPRRQVLKDKGFPGVSRTRVR